MREPDSAHHASFVSRTDFETDNDRSIAQEWGACCLIVVFTFPWSSQVHSFHLQSLDVLAFVTYDDPSRTIAGMQTHASFWHCSLTFMFGTL